MKRLMVHSKLILLIMFLCLFVTNEIQAQNFLDLSDIPEPYNQIAKEAGSGQVDLAIAKLNILIKKNPQDFFAYYLSSNSNFEHSGGDRLAFYVCFSPQCVRTIPKLTSLRTESGKFLLVRAHN